MARKRSAKEQIRQFLAANVGNVVTSIQIRNAAGADVSEWARRLRELRDEEGWKITSHNDDASLKQNEYMLTAAPPAKTTVKGAFARNLSAKLRAEVLDRDGFTCQMCGLTPSDIDPSTGRAVRLHIGHIVDKSLGGKDELSNLRSLCSTCNQGAKNVTALRPTSIWLLSAIRRAGQDEQRDVFEWLKKKFKA